MYNGQKIKALLADRGLRGKDLLVAIGLDPNSTILPYVDGDIRVSSLEKIADFFGVSIDTFFDRNPANYNAATQSSQLQSKVVNQDNIINSLQQLIAEKDKRISLLEQMVEMLKNHLQSTQSPGQISDSNKQI